MSVFVSDPYSSVQQAGETYIGNETDQVYSINPFLIQAGERVTIVDQGGANAIELPAGLEITDSQASSNELVLYLSNGAIVNVRGADTFTFNVGQNQSAGDNVGTGLNFEDFAQNILGVTLPAEGEAAVEGGGVIIDTTPEPEVPTFSIAADADAVDEGGTATFTVTLSDAPAVGEEVTVDYATADGTATAGEDYTAVTGTLTFGAGETIKTFTVDTTDDFAIQGDETFTVDLENVTGTIGGETPAIGTAPLTITITDNDVAVDSYTLTANPTTVIEGNNVTFTVTALDADGNPAGVAEDTAFNYQITGVEVAGGTATPADDLGEVTGAVTIEAGESTATFTLTPVDDGVAEGFEGFKVTLLDDAFETVAESGNVVINDKGDPTYSLVADEAAVDEGATATFTLTTTNVNEGDEVAYTISGVDAADVDGDLTGTAVVGADGTATIEVALAADNTTEGEETLTVTIDDDATATADVTVNDTSLDPDGAFLSIGNASVVEGDAGTTPATFTVTLSEAPGAGEEVTVDYATADGTATAGTDYVAATGTLTFAEGETTQTIEVTVNGDTEVETDETFNVVLSNVVGTIGGEDVLLPGDTAVGTITNDDFAPVEGETFTLTEEGAFLNDSFAQKVNPEETYLADANDTINAGINLNDATIEDPSTADSDVLSATLTDDTTALLTNIETLDLRAGTADPEFNFASVTGTELLNFNALSSQHLTVTDFVQDGSVEVALNNNKTLTLKTGTATADDSFDLSVEGSTGTAGGFEFDDSGSGAAVAVDAVDLESKGDAENIVTLGVDGANYTGIDALNLTGAADLDVTTPFVAGMAIDATDLAGSLSLGLDGGVDTSGGAVDLAENIDGEVSTLTVENYKGNATNELTTTDIAGLTEIRLGDEDGTANALVLGLAADVDVSVFSDNGNNQAYTFNVDGADTDENSSLTVNVGGTAAVVTGAVTAANIQNLTLNSVGDAANGMGAATTNDLESLSVDAAQDFAATSFSAADGAAEDTDIFAASTAGAGDVALGDLTTDGNVNGITLDNTGEGDRSFTVAAEGDLKAAEGASQAAGQGVVISGDGTGEVVGSADAALFDASDPTSLIFDAAGYANGSAYLDLNANTGDVDVDASEVTGIDKLIASTDLAPNGTSNTTISDLAAGIAVSFTTDQGDPGVGNFAIILDDDVTDRSVELANAVNGAMSVAKLQDNSAETLSISTDDENQTAANLHDIDTLTATSLVTLNVNAAENAPFELTSAYTTRDGVAGSRDFYVNIEGAGKVDFAGDLISGTGIDTIDINADGEGARDFDTITLGDLSDAGALTFTGDSDIDITTELALGADADGISANLNSDADITVANLTGNIAASKTVTINSESTDAETENVLTDASNLVFGEAGGGNPSSATLEITGNQDLTLGDTETPDATTYLGLGADDGDTDTLDASAFTGTLTAGLAREDAGASTTHTQTVKLGTGESNITIDDDGAAGTDDVFTFVVSEDGVGDVDITNFAWNLVDDSLDFSAFSDNQGGYASAGGVITLTMDGGDYDAETITFEDNADGDAVGTSDLFVGEITLTGVSTANLTADNFEDFA